MHEKLESSWQLGDLRAIIPRRQAQRGEITCLRSHSREVVEPALEPTCFPQAAQGNLQSHPPAYTPRKGQLWSRGLDRWDGAQDLVSIPTRTVEAKPLSHSRRLMAPARPRLVSAAKQLSSSDPSGSWGLPFPLPGALAATSSQGPGLSSLQLPSCSRPYTGPCDYIHACKGMVSSIPLTDLKSL